MRKEPKTKFKVGDKVRPKISKEAYYSQYAGNPHVVITPDMVGVVGAVNVPAVYGCKGKPSHFHCVDFVIADKFSGNPIHQHNTWRASFYENDIELV